MAEASQLSPSAYEDAFIVRPLFRLRMDVQKQDQRLTSLSSLRTLLLCHRQNTSNPKQTHTLLQTHLSTASKLNDQLADIFRERAAIEATYVSALQKLQAKKGAGGGVAREGLGGFSGVWEAVWGEVQEVRSLFSLSTVHTYRSEGMGGGWQEAESSWAMGLTSTSPLEQAIQTHTSLERKMKDEVETPLRSMSVRGDWAKQGTVRSSSSISEARIAQPTADPHFYDGLQYDGNIERTIKHYDACQTRLAKVRLSSSFCALRSCLGRI